MRNGRNGNVICKTVIVDDDHKSRLLLNKLLSNFSEVKVLGEADNLIKAQKIIRETHPNTIFFDIELNIKNDFSLINNLPKNIKLIFVSSKAEGAVKAFEVNALDFIQKPINKKRIGVAIKRIVDDLSVSSEELLNDFAKKKMNLKNESDSSIDQNVLTNNPNRLSYEDRIFLAKKNSSKFIKVNSILEITANKDYSYINTSDNQRSIILRTMKDWEKRLPEKYFARIHRSTIVNLEYIEKIEKWFNSSFRVYLRGVEEPFQMSRRYASKLKEKFK